jgi:transcription antitermination protein NusB
MNSQPPGKAAPALAARHRSREAAVQMLYQWEVGGLALADVRRVWSELTDEGEPLSADQTGFASTLAEGVAAHVAELDPLISEAAAHWRLERMNVIDRLVMRLAVYEFLHEPETPATVIINEALELARAFSSEEAVPFVNGVLDGIRRRLERA